MRCSCVTITPDSIDCRVLFRRQCGVFHGMLQVRRLEKIIENRSALYVEQLDINAGDVVAVVGLTGSGKTLLIRLLSGTMVPSGGKVLLDGQDIHQAPQARACIGVLFQEDLLYERQTA